ncbi:hypothetical protein MPH_01110 [Macrophomina phaseolina MS6]|uniref:Uncharacterized protein n=1 Tax=Macrophomina phaseolina (strain MS6) TaxID=1126212 RepID=K2S9N8_MACPH|nr:hypothetical protein MPH_01110 [Macrophomina phaseolina MS6]
MKSPVRAGTLASTFAVLIVICVIIRHSEYLRDRLDHIDEAKDGITGSWRGHLGIGGSKPSIDPKYLGFGTPSLVPTHNRTLSFSSPTSEPTYQQGSDETAKPGEERVAEETTSDVKEKQPPASGPDAESEEPAALEKEELKTDTEISAEDQLIRTGPDKIVVMGKTAEEDTTWVSEHLKE